jgi:hypothetical protein
MKAPFDDPHGSLLPTTVNREQLHGAMPPAALRGPGGGSPWTPYRPKALRVRQNTETNDNQHKRACAAYRSPMPWGVNREHRHGAKEE